MARHTPCSTSGSNSGVYRSIDKGKTWTLFPDQSLDGAPAAGGYLPHASVTDLDLSLGNIDVQTGRPNLAGPYDPTNAGAADPDLLLASTYGRGSFAIRLAPLVFPSAPRSTPAAWTRAGRHPMAARWSTPRRRRSMA